MFLMDLLSIPGGGHGRPDVFDLWFRVERSPDDPHPMPDLQLRTLANFELSLQWKKSSEEWLEIIEANKIVIME